MSRTQYYKDYNKSVKGRFRTAKANAKRRKIDFELTLDQYNKLTTNATCVFCKRFFEYTGIDRWKSCIKKYTLTNSVSCCKRCNDGKNDMCYDEFIEWSGLVWKNRHIE